MKHARLRQGIFRGRSSCEPRFAEQAGRRSTSNTSANEHRDDTKKSPMTSPALQTKRELFMNILESSATRRDARQYLSRVKAAIKEQQAQSSTPFNQARETAFGAVHWRGTKSELPESRVGPSSLLTLPPAASLAMHGDLDISRTKHNRFVHVALVSLKDPHLLDDVTLDGITRTLTQLVQLDMSIAMLIDSDHHSDADPVLHQWSLQQQADRLTKAFLRHGPIASRFVTAALESGVHPEIRVASPNLILSPLRNGQIPIIPTLAFTQTAQSQHVKLGDVMLAVTKCLTERPLTDKESLVPFSLDRIIILDQLGGIPSRARDDSSHIFINLVQEYSDVRSELLGYANETNSNPHECILFCRHIENLDILERCLAPLPSSSSGLIISPQEAVASSQSFESQPASMQPSTRKQKNVLIHNLLTNKPLVSSSLPTARMRKDTVFQESRTQSATLVKRGMPLMILPTPTRSLGWEIPGSGSKGLSLENDPRIDLTRLQHLIENSFKRTLDLRHYLTRINDRVAGIIIAGDYEGAAILTWEQPPGTEDEARLVPYLDKFAVLQSSQGSAGVADILFQAMVRSCFPFGVCWRSRKNNPVNKWYFERASGSWQIPNTQWTMFWTGDDVVTNKERFNDFVIVCQNILTSFK